MNNSINLLDYKNKPAPIKNIKRQKHLRLIALSLLFIVSSTSIMFFLLVAVSPIPELRTQQKTASLNLSKASEDILKLSIAKERAESINEIFDKRSKYEIVLENLQKKIPSGVTVRAVSIYKKDITITLSSKSLLLLDNFLNELIKAENAGVEFSNIKLLSIAAERNKDTFLLMISMNTI